MTKKFLAVTLVLVLAAGFAAVAQDMDRPLYGSWENTLTLAPTGSNALKGFSSTLDVTYVSGGITYNSVSEFSLSGLDDQEFSVETTVGLLDLSSVINFDPDPGLDFWKNTASLTLGGVSITDMFLLQDVEKNYWVQAYDGYGAGMDLGFSGETPGGVSVDVANYFGLEPVDGDAVGEITGYDYTLNAGYVDTIDESGYAIVTEHAGNLDDYAPSSFQYVGTKLVLENQSLGCCDFSSETLFSERDGFEYTRFDFTITSTNWPLELAGELKFESQTKSVVLTPSLTTNWACFDVYTDLSGTLANNGTEGSTITGLEVMGFAIKDVELGHVMFSSYTALSNPDDMTEYTVADLNDDFRGSYTYYYGPDNEQEYVEYLDEVIRIEKLDKFPLDFTADIYFDMTQSDGLFDLALFELVTDFELSDQFSLGTGLLLSPKKDAPAETNDLPESNLAIGGLDELTLSFDYSF